MVGSFYKSPTPCESKDEALAVRAITLVVGAPRWVFTIRATTLVVRAKMGLL